MTSRRFGGPWTEQKLEVLRQYLDRYTTVLKNRPFTLTYVDGFAGAGSYIESGDDYAEFHEFREGSARIALDIDDKPFDRMVFIEKDAGAKESLLILANEYLRRQIKVVYGDANLEIPRFCKNMAWNDRAVVFLDPYATQVSWPTVEAIAASMKIDCWILFPLMAVTRMMPMDREPNEANGEELDRIFGGRRYWLESYRDSPQLSLLDDEPRRQRAPGSRQIADRYRQRLSDIFNSVADARRTLTNSRNVPLFELFFAAGNPAGAKRAMPIANHILENW